ncbi:hypothetical protein KO361_04650 [Candidatus Woesearchaeota archaeon]|nr:hypothetical protein [Candidatus Woesearchaeota archaeon]
MSLLSFFSKNKISEWKDLKSTTKEALSIYEKYFLNFLERVELSQAVFLKSEEFIRKGIDLSVPEEYDTSGTNKAVVKEYSDFVSSNLNKIKALLNKEIKIDDVEKSDLEKINFSLKKTLSFSDDFFHEFKKDQDYLTILNNVMLNLSEQINLVEDITNSFLGEDMFNVVLSDKDLMNEFKQCLKKQIELLKKEFELLTNERVNSAAELGYKVEEALKNSYFEKNLHNILMKSEQIVKLFNEQKISLYHAKNISSHNSANIKILPLSEDVYPDNFYVTTKSPKAAINIKKGHSNNQQGVVIAVYEIIIPESLVSHLKSDANEGNHNILGSEEAYLNAYYIPLISFSLFNKYFLYGLIKEKHLFSETY